MSHLPTPLSVPASLFPGDSELAGLMRALDWSQTPLGPAQSWPQSLRTAVSLVLASPLPMIVLWGEDLVQLYNDGYKGVMGAKHPGGLGQPTRACWPEVWAFNAPLYQGVRERGEAFQFTDQRLVITRHGEDEEAYFTLTYSPVRDERGEVSGVLVTVIETTERVRAQAQLQAQHVELEARTRSLEVIEELTRDLLSDWSPYELIHRVQELLHGYLPAGMTVYYELDGDVWRVRSQVGEYGDAELERQHEEGLPYAAATHVVTPYETGEPYYQDLYDPQTYSAPETTAHVGAIAMLPLKVGGQVRGVFGFGRFGPGGWAGLSRTVMEAAVRSLGLALEHTEQARQLDEERAALAAFTSFTEAVGTQTDVLLLARQAIKVLHARFSDASVGYYEREEGRWKLRVWSEDMRADVVALMQAGVPEETPVFVQMLGAGQAVFIDAWDPVREQVEATEQYSTVATSPLTVHGEVRGALAVGLKDTRWWSERDKALVRAVGRGLTLALERTEQARQLQAQRDEVEHRNRALSAFAELTRDLSLQHDPYTLIQRAQEVVLSLLPPGYAVYFELEEGRWFIRAQVGDIRDPSLQAAADLGFPFDLTGNLTTPWTTRQPYYQDTYDPGFDHLREIVREVGTTAVVPVLVNGEPVGVFGTVLFDQHGWTPTDQGVLETVVRSLGLALEGARGVAQLAEEQRKLTAANEELEAFTYSVSHDLRTPVRHIVSFNDLLRKSVAGRLDDKETRYLRVVNEAAARMNTLIDAMLDLSRTSRLPLRLGLVDLGTLVAAVRAELELDVAERAVEWEVAPLPLVMGDHDTLRQVVVNLLHNALKYTRTREVTRVEVWAEDRPHEWAVCVRDNGVGFNPRYAERLFGVFQRLHRHEEFEGTGVGLANVRRIIARHGGRVWAEGRLGEGATFGFALPKPR